MWQNPDRGNLVPTPKIVELLTASDPISNPYFPMWAPLGASTTTSNRNSVHPCSKTEQTVELTISFVPIPAGSAVPSAIVPLIVGKNSATFRVLSCLGKL